MSGPHPPEPERERSASVGTAVLGAGPAGLTARTCSPCAARRAWSTRAATPSAGSPRPSSSTATASTSAATASSRSSTPIERLWEEMLGDDFLVRPAALAHLLRRQVPRLPAPGPRRRRAARARRVARCARSRTSGAAAAAAGEHPETLRGLGDGALRPAALRRVLPLLHGEGLGHPGLGDPGRVGGPADQGLLASGGGARDASTCSGRSMTTLIEEFHYPRLGPGQMWEALRASASRSAASPSSSTTACRRSATTARPA